ncbi:hypothetical protein BUE80_DR004031, partial [Diplocarpon rosae]
MVLKYSRLRHVPSFLVPFTQSIRANQTRSLHHTIKAKPIPKTTPFVPNAETFLRLIGRNLSQHASKIPSWKALFSLTSSQLKELGVDPPRSRRYLLRWREKFRNGQYGIGGDLKHVKKGVAELRIAEFPPLKGGKTAKLEVKEGLWEDRRGHKIDGGERRQAEVRAKKRGEQKRAR